MDWRPYVPVAERRRQAAKVAARMKKAGRKLAPIAVEGRKIAATFWGRAWCENLEAYSDYESRLPRGRTYVRNGSVFDLQIEEGRVRALVSGSDVYEVEIAVEPIAAKRWKVIKARCAGQIGSLVELLGGAISGGVMEIVTRAREGLFPSPREISLDCSCPDWADMCKHVAAALYGVGARLDHRPELLFTLRGVDPAEMVEAAVARPPAGRRARKGRTLATGDLSSVFGIDIDTGGQPAAKSPASRKKRDRKARTDKAPRKVRTARKKTTPRRA